MIFLPKFVSPIVTLAAQDQARLSMTGVRVLLQPDDHWRLEATDGKLLGIARGPSSPTPGDEEAAALLPEPQSLASELVVPSKEFAAAFKALPKPGKKDKGDPRSLGVQLSSSSVTLLAGDGVLECLPVEARFPAVDSVLPKKPAVYSVTVDAEKLIGLLKVAAAISKTREGDGMARVELLFWSRTSPFGVICQGAGGVTFDGIIMPLT